LSNEQDLALIGSLYGLAAWLLKPPYKPICRMPVRLSKNVKHFLRIAGSTLDARACIGSVLDAES
jgi:hypothetical protein